MSLYLPWLIKKLLPETSPAKLAPNPTASTAKWPKLPKKRTLKKLTVVIFSQRFPCKTLPWLTNRNPRQKLSNYRNIPNDKRVCDGGIRAHILSRCHVISCQVMIWKLCFNPLTSIKCFVYLFSMNITRVM